MSNILISACLSGFPVRYNGTEKKSVGDYLAQWRQQARLITFCPELAAGFSTPRPSAEIIPVFGDRSVIKAGARVVEATGNDVTARYILGAWLTLQMAQQHNCRFALLTEGSPSCGSNIIYSGQFDGSQMAGSGVTAELLRHHGIEVFSDCEIERLIERVEYCDRHTDV
ncbi:MULTISPECIES: DUF523 domain-containing protein [Pectobacterium]|uniref:DUF523 domain-containing protein n=1 Tax=Pectobacterium punjabense TaxID=2108399 RepID=A0ABX6L520_9GAMM|nr:MULTISPECIES: DUF523 domain-containing protein [Pectobacterium]GKW10535.1 hypothetical protein PEC301899_08170 [Pectobacterium carotovorum subsp. carotovorum]MBN3137819.1 DUF523 domain-containing protein [Pectobacterium punjabense]MBS4431619.1 DUF523 domain-containing protein [Pectobacterium punjabense]MBT9185672.1 DUF523 domain-containing protein [Pectobacterium punjabense]MCE5379796.1 DUF523 domain-containing protein [Pectobacterium punjabense]